MRRKKDPHSKPRVLFSWHSHKDPEIITTTYQESEPVRKETVKGKKPVLLGLLIITILILAGAGLYYYILPRVDVQITTVYHEGAGGASSGGFINVNTQIKNAGTKTLESFNITLEILDAETEEAVDETAYSYPNIRRGEEEETKVEFLGDHYQPHKIKLWVTFQAAGKTYIREYTYHIGENDPMNLVFEENISEWRF